MSALCREAFRRFHIFTVPLSPTRASFLLGGRNKHMGYEAYQVQQPRPCQPLHDESCTDVVLAC